MLNANSIYLVDQRRFIRKEALTILSQFPRTNILLSIASDNEELTMKPLLENPEVLMRYTLFLSVLLWYIVISYDEPSCLCVACVFVRLMTWALSCALWPGLSGRLCLTSLINHRNTPVNTPGLSIRQYIPRVSTQTTYPYPATTQARPAHFPSCESPGPGNWALIFFISSCLLRRYSLHWTMVLL